MKRIIFTTISILGAFGAGLYAGSYVTQKKMQEEISAMEEYWTSKIEKIDSPEEIDDEEIKVAEEIMDTYNYNSCSATFDDTFDKPGECEIEIVDSEEYGSDLTYDMVDNMTYYADGYLVDEWDEVIENYSDLIGEEAFSYFEDGVVFVKNNVTKTYYQVLKSDEKYSDIVWETKIHCDD